MRKRSRPQPAAASPPIHALSHTAVTQRDVAVACGLHQTTVSLALRHDPRIAPDTVTKVLEAAAAIGYDPSLNTTARRLAMRRFGRQAINHVIALSVHPQFTHFHYNAAIFGGIADVLLPAGFALTLTRIDYEPATYEAIIPTIFSRGDVDALITESPPDAVTQLAERLRRAPGFANRGIVGLVYRHQQFSSVITDDHQGACDAARHLLALGHRHLLQLCTTMDEPRAGLQALRWAGVRQALTEFGLDPARHLRFCVIPPEWGNPLWLSANNDAPQPPAQDPGCALTRAMADHPEITAVLGINDACAQQAWHALNQAGYAVPDDVSIVGFDDVDPRFDDNGNNILSSVRLPLVEMGRIAAELAIEHVTGRLTEKREVLLPVQFIPRGSVGPARACR